MTSTTETAKGASIPQLAVEAHVSEALLYSLANQNKLPGCRRLGRRFVIHAPTFWEWIASGQGA